MEAIGALGLFGALAVVSIAAAAIGSAMSQSRAAVAAFDALWRQPEAGSTIQTSLILALAFMEALTLFVFLLILIVAGQVAG
ncbi:MAG: ATP synthase F0 subunit C [Thermaerobacterales bacterium]